MMLGGCVYFFAAMPCCFFFIKMILTSIQNVLVTICTKHDEQKPHVFFSLFVPRNSWSLQQAFQPQEDSEAEVFRAAPEST